VHPHPPRAVRQYLVPVLELDRNMALGKGSVTVPSSTMASSLGFGRCLSSFFLRPPEHRAVHGSEGIGGVTSERGSVASFGRARQADLRFYRAPGKLPPRERYSP